MEELNNKPVKLDIGEQLNHAFEVYKKIAVIAGLAILSIYFIIAMLSFIAMGFFFKVEELPELMKDFNPDHLSIKGQLLYLLGVVVFVSLISPFVAGILKMAKDADNDEEVQFSSIFSYINSPQFIHIVLVTAIITIVSNGMNMALKFILPDTLATLLGVVVSIVIGILTYLVIPLIVFKHLNFIDAIKVSIQQISNNFIYTVALMIVAFLFSAAGIIAFCLGVIFTLPFMYAMHYSVYKKLNS